MQKVERLLKILTSGDDHQAEAAAQKLPDYGDDAYHLLLRLLKSTDPDIRWWTIRALANFTKHPVTEHLILALTDPDLSVQQCAARALCEHPSYQSINPLINTINSNDPILARLAGEALITIGEEAVECLIQVLEKSSPSAQVEAARALAMIADPKAIPALFSALGTGSALLEYWANEGLNRMESGMVYFDPRD